MPNGIFDIKYKAKVTGETSGLGAPSVKNPQFLWENWHAKIAESLGQRWAKLRLDKAVGKGRLSPVDFLPEV